MFSFQSWSLLFLLWFSLLLLTPTPSCPFPLQNYLLGIVNGEYAKSTEWPMMVSLQINEKGHWKHFCGGTVYNSLYILSAAHCMFEPKTKVFLKDANIRAFIAHANLPDENSKFLFKVTKLIPHEKFNPKKGGPGGYDIGLFKLSRAIDFRGDNYEVTCTCQEMEKFKPLYHRCYVVGWGADNEGNAKSDWLQEVKVPLREKAYCDEVMASVAKVSGLLCAGWDEGRYDACSGDSGGPLFCTINNKVPLTYIQVGVVSFGAGCAKVDAPGFYTSVGHYKSWLKNHTGCG